MHIALVTETFPPEVNGVARTLHQLCAGLTERGHRLDLVRPRQPEDGVEDDPGGSPWDALLTGGQAIPFYHGLRFGHPAYRRLKARWRRQPPDVVHIATEGPLGLSALVAARSLGLPICSSFHTNFHQYSSFYGAGLLTRPAVAYLRAFHNRTGRTLVPTEDVVRLLLSDGFERLDVLSRGVDTALFDPRRRSDALRRGWGAEPDDPVAVYVGRLAPEKDPALAVEAFRRLRATIPRCRTVMVGDGPAAEETARLDPETVFCGMRRGEDLAEHYASADFLVFPSRTETFGNVVLEAMASGLPVVSYDYAAAGLLINTEQEGLTVPLDDREAWLEAAVRLGTLPAETRRRMGRAARRRAESETWDRIVDRFVTLLSDVRAQQRSTARAPVSPMAEPPRGARSPY